MNPVYEKLQSCLKSVRAKTDFQPKIALILGSGLGDYADGIEIETRAKLVDVCANQRTRYKIGNLVFHHHEVASMEIRIQEVKMCRLIGGDAVGMSTVPEVIVARHCGIKVFGVSIITDLGGFDVPVEVSHEEVQKAANAAQPIMTEIMREMIRRS